MLLLPKHASVGLAAFLKKEKRNFSWVQPPEHDPVPWQYIATQGPLPHTVHMFWHMIVEQRCSAIVMLTEVTEGKAHKCCPYFPQNAGERLVARIPSESICLIA
jgi:protein tyrosine phosphatase